MSTIHMSHGFAEWPFPYVELMRAVLDGIWSRGCAGACRRRPEKARRRRRNGRGEPGGLRAPKVLPSLAGDGPGWPGRTHRRNAGGCSGGDGDTAAVVTGKWAREGRREALDA